MDANPEDPLARIAFFGLYAMPAVILYEVVGYLDALGGLEQDTDLACKVR